METTFMTIHNLDAEANITYASVTITEILGYQPAEVVGKSCFDYFHPDEIPFARDIHNRGVLMDKAAALHYARIRGRDGQWVSCECVFTIVYNVLVACTSIYKGDAKTQLRAAQASSVRHIFASSPRDPRYHMLEHLSSKFRSAPQSSLSEPRAALVLNRFAQNLPVMFATDAVASILGCTVDQIMYKSFYECMQVNCQWDAVRCLESAKQNDSIAYLRFWHRDPRRPEDFADEVMRDASQSSDSDDGGVRLRDSPSVNGSSAGEGSSLGAAPGLAGGRGSAIYRPIHSNSPESRYSVSRTSSGESTDIEHDQSRAIFDRADAPHFSDSSVRVSSNARRARTARAAVIPAPVEAEPYEIEAVVSCTSDGLVVILRRARPAIPNLRQGAAAPAVQQNPNGFYAAPWGANPIHPHVYQPVQNQLFQHGLDQPEIAAGGPPMEDFMNSIREVAVFAWALTGINGNVASYGRGTPRGEAQPLGGVPVWNPYIQPVPEYVPPENQAAERWSWRDRRYGHLTNGQAAERWSQPDQRYGHTNNEHEKPPQYPESNNAIGHRGHSGIDRNKYYFQGPGSYAANGYESLYGNAEYQAHGHYQPYSSHEHSPRGSGQGSAGDYNNGFYNNNNPWQ